MSDEVQDLVAAAFDQARRSGKPEWWVMTVPVLKNRLLQMTDRHFDPSAYGFETIADLVSSPDLSTLISVDSSSRPARVELRDADHGQLDGVESSIRPDLWTAILDYSSDTPWSWNPDSAEVTEGEDLLLPTLTPVEMDQWRAEFAGQHGGGDKVDGRLAQWMENRQGANALPLSLRGPWYGFLKAKVAARLRSWFESHSLDPPDDLLVSKRQRGKGPAEGDLRAYLHRVIDQMSAEELRMVQLPAVAAARLGGHRS